jgi:hypothetical protein
MFILYIFQQHVTTMKVNGIRNEKLTLRGFEMLNLHCKIGPTRLFFNSFHLIGEISEACRA